MTDIPIEGKVVPLKQGNDVADGEHIAVDPTNFGTSLSSSVTDVQLLADAVSGLNFVPGTPGTPYKYFQKLSLGSGIAQLPTGSQPLNSGNSFKFTHVIVPEIQTIGGIVPDVPFFSEYYGSFRARVTTAVTLVLTSRFYHFSNTANEFVNIQRTAFRFSSDRESEIFLRSLSSPPITLGLGTLNIPNGPTFNVTREFLNTTFPFRVELDIEAFDTTTGNTPTATTLSDMEFIEPTIVYSQLNETVLTDQGTEIFAGILRYTDTNGDSLPLIDGTSQTTFDTTLGEVSRVKGYAYRFRSGTVPTEGALYTLGFFGPFDVLVAKVDNASVNAAGDWNILRTGISYPVSSREAQFLDQVREEDNAIDALDASSSGQASFVRFWLRSTPVTQGTINNPGTGLLTSEAQDGSFTQNTDALAFILYIGLPDTYVTTVGVANLRVQITDIDGTVVQSLPLSTTFTEATELSTAGTTYYRSSSVAHSEFIGYEANETIRLFRTTLQRHFTLTDSPTVDVTQNVTDLPESRLSQSVQDKLNQIVDGHPSPAEIQSLENKVATLYPLATDVDILTDWSDVYDPAHAVENVSIVDGYTLLADFRATNDRYESAGVTYTAGTGMSRYSGLTTDQHRCFGFKVTAPSALTLLNIMDGATAIPFIDMTAAGNFRVNNFVPTRFADEVHRDTVNFATLSAGDAVLTHTANDVATYTVPDYPASSEDQSRLVAADIEVLVNGNDTNAAGGISFDIPDTDVAQAVAEISHTFFTGFPSNRTITATFSHEVRISGSDVLLDLRLVSAPSDVTFRINNVDVLQTYTTTSIIARVDRWLVLQDASGDFTFTGENELLVAFHPQLALDNKMDVVPVVVDSAGATTQLNDARISIPTPLYATVDVPDTIEFRTFLPDNFLRHIDLVNLLRDRATKWVYALARLNTVTERAFTQTIDLADGTLLNGTVIRLPEINEVHQSLNTGTSTDGLVNSVVLPSDYADFDLAVVTVFATGTPNEWQTGAISIPLLESGNLAAGDNIRIPGGVFMRWTVGTRTLAESASTQNMWRVELVKN